MYSDASLLLDFVLLFAGLALLTLGAEWLVRGGARLATRFGISPLVVGLTIVAFGTSAPELAVSVGAGLRGAPDLALGNVIGSNIANILLILGVTAIIGHIQVHSQLLRQEIPVLLGAVALFCTTSFDGILSRLDGLILFSSMIAYTVFLLRQARTLPPQEEAGLATDIPRSRWDEHAGVQMALVLVGLGLLIYGADLAVGAASGIARSFGVSELVIGLTVVAVGTSLPEIATSVVAALRGHRDMAVGNVIGSCTFNLLSVLGATALVAPHGILVSETIRHVDSWVMLGTTVVLLPIIVSGAGIRRSDGALLLAFYLAYLVHLGLDASAHPWREGYIQLMLSFVLPLAMVYLMVRYVQSIERRQ